MYVDVVLTVYLSKAKLSVDVVLTVYLSKAKLSVDVRIHIVYLQHNAVDTLNIQIDLCALSFSIEKNKTKNKDEHKQIITILEHYLLFHYSVTRLDIYNSIKALQGFGSEN